MQNRDKWSPCLVFLLPQPFFPCLPTCRSGRKCIQHPNNYSIQHLENRKCIQHPNYFIQHLENWKCIQHPDKVFLYSISLHTRFFQDVILTQRRHICSGFPHIMIYDIDSTEVICCFFFFRDRTLSVTIYCSFHVRVHNLHTRSLSHHWWCSRIQSYVCGTWEIPESPLWDENSELCGTFTHLIWDAIPWLSVTHCPYFKNRMWGTPSKTIFYSFISGIWVKIWLRPNGTAECGPWLRAWGRHVSSIVFIRPLPE